MKDADYGFYSQVVGRDRLSEEVFHVMVTNGAVGTDLIADERLAYERGPGHMSEAVNHGIFNAGFV